MQSLPSASVYKAGKMSMSGCTDIGSLYSSGMVGNNSPAGMGFVIYIKECKKKHNKRKSKENQDLRWHFEGLSS